MEWRRLHPWNVSPGEAQAIQRHLASQVSRQGTLSKPPELVAGVDISPPDAQGKVRGAVVIVQLPGLEMVEVKTAQGTPGMPYIPGLLSFRESPVILAALERLVLTPDLLLVDGQGVAHPRRFGLASHLGLLIDGPAVGCAKSILCGRYGHLEEEAGSWNELVDRGEVIGAAVRTRSGVSPIVVSIGHKIDLGSAIRYTLACCKGYRMPEPTRLAHQAAAGRIPDREPAAPASRQAQLF